MLRVFAPAKVNLCLHVTGQLSDGYHLLDTIVGFADVGDVLEMQLSPKGGVKTIGPEAAELLGAQNIVDRTLEAFDGQGVQVTLTKNLPVSSGIGGGSSDAAAAYRGLCALLARGELASDAAALLKLGADVPMCVRATCAHVQGIGERITPLPNLAPLHAVLVNPRVAVSTPAVFKALIKKENTPIPPLPANLSDAAVVTQFLKAQRNDLQSPAQEFAPAIAEVLAALAHSGAALARMSGSGATCFGIYDSAALAKRAAAVIDARSPKWWIAPTLLNGAIETQPQAIRATT